MSFSVLSLVWGKTENNSLATSPSGLSVRICECVCVWSCFTLTVTGIVDFLLPCSLSLSLSLSSILVWLNIIIFEWVVTTVSVSNWEVNTLMIPAYEYKLPSILKKEEIDCRILIAHKSLEFTVRQFKVFLMHIFIQRWMIGKGGVKQGHNLEKKLIYIEWLLYIWYRNFSFF